VRLLQLLGHHPRVTDSEEASLKGELLGLRPRLGDDLDGFLEAVAVFLLRHVVAAELRRTVAAPEADLQSSARDDVDERGLLRQPQRMVERQDRRGQPDAHAPRARGGDGRERAGIDGEPIVDEVVLGEPDLIEAELLRPLHLFELTVHDLVVAQPWHGLEEVEGPESHGRQVYHGARWPNLSASTCAFPAPRRCPTSCGCSDLSRLRDSTAPESSTARCSRATRSWCSARRRRAR